MAQFDGNGKLLKRKGTNFFHKLHVSTTDFADYQISWDFISQGFSIINESFNSNDVVQYSFDGTTVHGDLTPGLPSAGLVFDNRRASKIWFKLESEGNPVKIRIEAWRNDY